MVLAPLAVVFAGVAGDPAMEIAHQLAPVLDAAQVSPIAVPPPDLDALVHDDDSTAAIVQALHRDGVIAAELTPADGAFVLRFVAYRADGQVVLARGTPIANETLTGDELAAVAATIAAALDAIPPAAPPPEQLPAVTPREIAEATSSSAEASAEPAAPHVHAELGFGVVARELSPGAATVAAYSSSAVGAIRGSGGIDVTSDLHLAMMAEQALAWYLPGR